MRVKAMRRVRYGGRDYHTGEEFDIADKFARAMVGTKMVEPAVFEEKQKPVQTRQVKAEEEPPKQNKAQAESGKYKRRDLRASED